MNDIASYEACSPEYRGSMSCGPVNRGPGSNVVALLPPSADLSPIISTSSLIE